MTTEINISFGLTLSEFEGLRREQFILKLSLRQLVACIPSSSVPIDGSVTPCDATSRRDWAGCRHPFRCRYVSSIHLPRTANSSAAALASLRLHTPFLLYSYMKTTSLSSFFTLPFTALTFHPTQGIQRTWKRLLAGDSGIGSTRHLGEEYTRLPSQVAGLVPLGNLVDGGWDAAEHVSREVSCFVSYVSVC
jgi:hypothetical protein